MLVFGGVISVVWRLVFWLILAFVISVFVEWLGMAVGWWPREHSHQMLNQEITYLAGYNNSVYGVPPSVLALGMIDKASAMGIDRGVELAKSLGGIFTIAASSMIT